MKNMRPSLNKKAIEKNLNVIRPIYVSKTTGSTNEDARTLVKSHETAVVLSECQTFGKGRLSRNFYSPAKEGLYMSFLLRPRLKGSDAGLITSFAAVCVVRALNSLTGLDAKIKWINDVVVGKKKLCGILTEGELSSSGDYSYVIIGIGINVSQVSFPDDISSKATSVLIETGKDIDRNLLASMIINEMDSISVAIKSPDFFKEYLSYSCVVGKEFEMDGKVVRVTGIKEDMSLIIEQEGKQKVCQPEEITFHNNY